MDGLGVLDFLMDLRKAYLLVKAGVTIPFDLLGPAWVRNVLLLKQKNWSEIKSPICRVLK